MGFLLALCHVFTFLFVLPNAIFHLSNEVNPMCWQYFPDCGIFHISYPAFWIVYFLIYLALSIFTMTLFCRKKWRQAYIGLVTLTLLKISFLSLDRSFMGNYHFMHLIYSAVFLFFPQKEISLKIILIWFYLAAGTLKLNFEWLSGASLGKSLPFLLPSTQLWANAYVVLLELVLIWGLFSKKSWIRWGVFAQLLAFHLISFYWVGFFYPTIMLSLLMIFPFTWQERPHYETQKPLAIFALIALLSALHLSALFGVKDPAIFTERRLLSMNMYDARAVCDINMFIHREGELLVYQPDLKAFGVRVHCDTGLVLNQARNICRERQSDPQFKSLDLFMKSKRLTDTEYQTVFNQKDVCGRLESIPYWDWLRAEL